MGHSYSACKEDVKFIVVFKNPEDAIVSFPPSSKPTAMGFGSSGALERSATPTQGVMGPSGRHGEGRANGVVSGAFA
jgi:hypothetical protein